MGRVLHTFLHGEDCLEGFKDIVEILFVLVHGQVNILRFIAILLLLFLLLAIDMLLK